MKTTINKKMRVITVALLLSGLVPSTMMAQDKVEASVGADLVSGYIWRGQDLGGVSVQPSLEISYKGFSLGAWGIGRIRIDGHKRVRFNSWLFDRRF